MPLDYRKLSAEMEAVKYGDPLELEVDEQRFGKCVTVLDLGWRESQNGFQYRMGSFHFLDEETGDYFSMSYAYNIVEMMEQYSPVEGRTFGIKRMADYIPNEGKANEGKPRNQYVVQCWDSKTGERIEPKPSVRPPTQAEKAEQRAATEPKAEVINLDSLDDDDFFGKTEESTTNQTVIVDTEPSDDDEG